MKKKYIITVLTFICVSGSKRRGLLDAEERILTRGFYIEHL
ncbi:hypothetical protein [Clostridium sp.]